MWAGHGGSSSSWSFQDEISRRDQPQDFDLISKIVKTLWILPSPVGLCVGKHEPTTMFAFFVEFDLIPLLTSFSLLADLLLYLSLAPNPLLQECNYVRRGSDSDANI